MDSHPDSNEHRHDRGRTKTRVLQRGWSSESGFHDIKLVTGPSAEYLNPRQQEDYRSEREDCITWLLTSGKDPKKHVGYATATVESRSKRMNHFYRWVWDEVGEYTANISTNHADAYLKYLARYDSSNAHKTNFQKALQSLFKWRHHERGAAEWEPSMKFSEGVVSQPRDYLTQEERKQVRESALEYGSVPGYSNLLPLERDRWRAYLAQRFEKPKEDVEIADWDRVNGYKIPSLVCTSLGTGLRPVEVERAKTSWVDVDSAVLRIPKEDSAKSHEHWVIGLKERTAVMLGRWLE